MNDQRHIYLGSSNILKTGWVITAILFFLSTHLAFSQYGNRFRPPGDEDVQIGFHFAAGASGMKFTDIAPLPGTNAVNLLSPNFDLGFFYQKKTADRLSTLLEFNFATRPGKITFIDGSYTWTHYNIEVPILLKFELIPDLYLYGGMQIGKMVKAKIRRIENAPLPFLDSTTNLIPTYTLLNAGLIGGINYDLNQDFGLDMRGIYGLTDLAKFNNPYKGLRFLTFEFGIRYNLPLGKSAEYFRY